MDKFKVYKIVLAQGVSRKDELPRFFNEIQISPDKFLKAYIASVQELASYFKVLVTLRVNIDRTYSFSVGLPTVGFFISLLQFVYVELSYYTNRVTCSKKNSVRALELVNLGSLKFGKVTYETFKSLCATARGMGLFIVF